jgi:phospholipid-binding lipoprotein MlaA
MCLFGSASVFAQTPDPWMRVNQKIFSFNDFFDRVLVRPIAITYTTFLPRPVRQGIGNFFSNIDDINVFANDLLQLKLNDALSDSGRFALNSTVGIGGFLDVASGFGLEKNEEDFGQTLGRWGVGSGPYVVLPVFGTSNVRDSFGLVLDTLFNPIQYYDKDKIRLPIFMLREIDTRASLLALDELVGGDKYLFFREAYVQRRQYLVNDGEVTDSFFDF